MNRTSNSTNTIKFNYAQAAAQPKSKQHQNPHHQNQQQQQQKIQQTNSPSHSNNPASSVNGKPSQKSQPPTNSTLSNGNAGRSAPENKVAQQKNPVTLPAKARQWETNTSIQFGSINQPSANPPLSSSPVQSSLVSGGKIPSSLSLPKNGTPTFGTVTARGPSEELVQPTPTQPAIAPTSSGSATGAPKPLATRIQNEIPRTQSAPPLLNLQDPTNAKNVGQPSGHQMNTMTSRTQQQLPAATPLQPISTSNPPHHRKDSVSSTVSSNDGQQTQPYHPHQPQPHHNNYNQQHPHYNRHVRPTQVPTQFHRGNRDKNVPGTIPPSSHSNPQSVPNQIQAPIPMTGPQATTIPMQVWQSYGRQYDPPPPYYPYPYYMTPVIQRPPTMPVASHMPQNVSQYATPGQHKSRAIPIIDPNDKTPVNLNVRPPVIPAIRREEISVPGVVDAKRTEDVDKEKEQVLDNDRKESKAVPIVNPVDKSKIEREKKEKEEREQKVREEEERRERERVEREKEKERLEKEERERKEKEEKERIEREQKERIEREEKERKEREEKERREREEKEREEKERKEREEKERKEREERERKEREENERKEREERERKEREERERKEREEKEREERERKEREERERKEREEKERLEQERLEREEKERREREEAKQKEKEAERIAQEERERAEQEEEMERQKKKKETEEEEKKKEFELSDKKDVKEEKKYGKGHRPEALDLSRTTSAPALGTGPLSSARIIDDLSSVQYPAHIKSPNPALNVGSDPGKFKYDRIFLMQFMEVCKDKPESLPALDVVGMEETKDDKKGGSRNSRTVSRASPHLMKNPSGQPPFAMGEFKKSDSNYGTRAPGFGRSTLGSRTGSGSMMLPPQANMNPPSPGRVQNAGRRNDKHKKTQYGQNMGQESVVPLEFTENRWIPMMHNKEMDDHMETIQRKVKALLNKLTLEKFDSISDQIIEFANRSRDETDGRILKEVISLTFDKSCDEPNFSQMYAQLCRKMMERIDPEIMDENFRNSENKYVQGGALFRKYLLNRCQENFEKGWKVNVPVPSNEKGEPDLMSDEYYTAARAKRHGLGLIRFIGELFKLNMLTERIMHECIKKLLTSSPEEEEMESLCKLLTTVGQQLDHAKAKSHMDTYFSRMEDLSKNAKADEKNTKISSRISFMIMDVIELRNNNWVPRRDNNAPKTIAEIHEDAAKQKEEAEFMRRTASSGGRGLPKMADQMSRAGSGRRGDKGSGSHSSGGQQADGGWSMVGGGSSSASRKTGDLSKFGSVRNKVSGSVNLTPGGGAFGGSKWKTDNKDRDDKTLGMSRVNSASNTYSVLTHTDTEPRKSSDGPLERKKLQLTSRTIPEEGIKSIMTKPSSIPPPMSEEIARKKIDNMIEEYFNVLDLGEVVICINELPKEYHSKAITEFANKVLEKKQEDVHNVIKVFRKLVSEGAIPKSVFMSGFASTMEFLIEISADAPKSFTFAGQLLYGSSIELKEVAELLKPLSGEDDTDIEKVMAGFFDEWKKASDEQEIVKKVKDTGFDFKSSIFPKKSTDEINKFLDEHGLGSLKK